MTARRGAASILVVDEDESIFKALSRALRRDGYSLTYSPHAEAALGALERQAFDVLLSDNRMPGMTGLELLELARIRHATTVRMLMSSDVETALLRKARESGMVFRMLSKPWTEAELRTSVRFAVQHARELAFGAHLNGELPLGR